MGANVSTPLSWIVIAMILVVPVIAVAAMLKGQNLVEIEHPSWIFKSANRTHLVWFSMGCTAYALNWLADLKLM